MGTQVRAARRVAATLAVALLLTAGGLSAEAATPAAAPVSQSVVDPGVDPGGVPGVGLPGRGGATVNGYAWYPTYFTLTMTKAVAKAVVAGTTVLSAGLYALVLGPIVAAAVVAGIYAFFGSLSQSTLDSCNYYWRFAFTYTGRLVSAQCTRGGGGGGTF